MFWRRRGRLDEEIRSHIAEETADNIARGLDPEAARAAALRTFGNVERAKEIVRERNHWYWLDTLSQDVRFACRLIVRSPLLSATIIATLTIGIAINVSVFSLVNGFLLRPWVRSDPEMLVSVLPRFTGDYNLRYSDGGMSQPDYARLRYFAGSLSSLAAYRLENVTLGGRESGIIRAGLVSCNVTDVLRPDPPILGRYLRRDECELANAASVAVLSEPAWRTRFASAPDIVGRLIYLNRRPFTVVGVSPSLQLPGPGNDSELWIPYTMLGQLRPAEDSYDFADPRAQWLNVMGRRKADRSLRQVEEELRAIVRSADAEVPGRRTTVNVTDGALIHDPDIRQRAPAILTVTLGTTTVLLLLACVNVTTLLLSRSAARQREIAVRLSLGAGRIRLLRQLLTESLVLSGVSALASLLIVQRAPEILWSSVVSFKAPFDLKPDWRVLFYCLAVAVAAGVIAGLSPSLESLKPQVSESLKGGSGAVTLGRRRSRLRSALVAVQVALSLLLVVQVVLFVRSQQRYFSYDPGFETRQVVNVTFASVLAGYKPPVSFYEAVESRVNAIPGVVRTSFASLKPWHGRNSTTVREIDGTPIAVTGDFRDDPARRVVTADYFSTLSIPVIRGRVFTRQEISSQTAVVPVVISEAMATRYWPGQDPLGHQFRLGNRRPNAPRSPIVHEIVGVCRDVQSVKYMQDDGPFYYPPLNVQQTGPPYLLVRISGDTRVPAGAIGEIVRGVDPQMAVTVETLASLVEHEGAQMQPVMMFGAAGGFLALLLALTGVYAVVSFSVSQRTREIGIRVALGAQHGAVVGLIMRSSATPVIGGIVVGLVLALTVSQVMKSVLLGVNPRDPITLIVVALLLLSAAIMAVWIPARRAAALDPLVSLRHE
jgi:predicted permease